MQNTENRKLAMLARVDNFCAVEHAGDFPAKTRGGELAQSIKQNLTAVNDEVAAQATAARLAQAGTDGKEAARNALRSALEQLSQTARGMDADMPGTAASFKLPARTDNALIAAAHAFQTNATPLKAEFIKNELPADFLTQLQQHLSAFEQARTTRATQTGRQVAATASIRALLAAGVNAVRQLDPIVRNKYHADPATLAAWASASHIERAPHRKPAAPKTDVPAAKP